MNAAEYLNAAKALELGLLDEITGPATDTDTETPKAAPEITNQAPEAMPKIFTLKALINRVKSVIMADSSVETDIQNAAEIENNLQVAHNRIKALENELEALRIKSQGSEEYLKNELAKVKTERDNISKTIAQNVAKQIANLGLNADECPAPMVKNQAIDLCEIARREGIQGLYKYI